MTKIKHVSAIELLAIIQRLAFDTGSQKAVALEKGISPGYLSDVLCQRREISAQFARKFGYQKHVTFTRLGEGK